MNTLVNVDMTATTDDGLIRVRAGHLAGLPPFDDGRVVAIADAVNETTGTAVVVRHNKRTGLAYLRPTWDGDKPTLRERVYRVFCFLSTAGSGRLFR